MGSQRVRHEWVTSLSLSHYYSSHLLIQSPNPLRGFTGKISFPVSCKPHLLCGSPCLLTNQHIFIFPLMKISRNDLFIHDLSLKTSGHYMLIPSCVSLSPETSTGFQKIRGVHEWKGFGSWIRSPPTILLGCLDKRKAVFSFPRARERTSMVMACGGQFFPAGWLPHRVTSHKGCEAAKRPE